MNTLAINRKARADYEILQTYQAGMGLDGLEVKATKMGRINLVGSYVIIRGGEVWLLNASIAPYQPKNTPSGYEPQRSRKLLLRKSEIQELMAQVAERGLTIVPLRVYTKRGLVKLEIALARGKKKWDRRETIKAREAKRDIERTLKRG